MTRFLRTCVMIWLCMSSAWAYHVRLDVINHTPQSFQAQLFSPGSTEDHVIKRLREGTYGPSSIAFDAYHLSRAVLKLTPLADRSGTQFIALRIQPERGYYQAYNCQAHGVTCVLHAEIRGEDIIHVRLDIAQ